MLNFFIINAQQVVERGVVEEYKGREAKSPLAHVEISVRGANPVVTDSKGQFKLLFQNAIAGENIFVRKIVREDYIIFNQQALDNWRLSGNETPFRIVMCSADSFEELVTQYYGIYEKNYRNAYNKACAELKEAYAKQKLQKEEYEKRFQQLQDEFNRQMKDVNNYAERFARIDEEEISEIEYEALKLFKEGKLDEAIQCYEDYNLNEQIKNNISSNKAAKSIIETSENNLEIDIKLLSQKIEWRKLSGKANRPKLIDDLNLLIETYKVLDKEENKIDLSNAQAALAYLYREEGEFGLASELFYEAALLGNSDGLYEYALELELYGPITAFEKAKQLYIQAAEKGNPKAQARMEDMWDFFAFNNNGVQLYYKILDKDNKTVKLTYKSEFIIDAYPDYLYKIPDSVEYEGSIYKVEEIGNRAFKNSFIKRLQLPDGIKRFGSEAFASCYNLEYLNLPKALESLGDNCFSYSCPELNLGNGSNFFPVRDGVLYGKDYAKVIYCDRNVCGDVRIDDRVKRIERGAFNKCKLKTIYLNDGLEYIGESAFSYCDNLRLVRIPQTIDSICDNAFQSCPQLERLTIPDSIKYIGQNALGVDIQDLKIPGDNGYYIKQDVLLLNSNKDILVKCSTKAKKILVVPEGVKKFEPHGFSGTNIFSILLPSTLDTISYESLFYSHLVSLILPDGVKTVEDAAMSSLFNMVELYIPSSTKYIGSSAVYGASNLQNVYVFNEEPPICGKNAFGDILSHAVLHVPVGKKDHYANSAGWADFEIIRDDLRKGENTEYHNWQEAMSVVHLHKLNYSFDKAEIVLDDAFMRWQKKMSEEDKRDFYFQKGILDIYQDKQYSFEKGYCEKISYEENSDTILLDRTLVQNLQMGFIDLYFGKLNEKVIEVIEETISIAIKENRLSVINYLFEFFDVFNGLAAINIENDLTQFKYTSRLYELFLSKDIPAFIDAEINSYKLPLVTERIFRFLINRIDNSVLYASELLQKENNEVCLDYLQIIKNDSEVFIENYNSSNPQKKIFTYFP